MNYQGYHEITKLLTIYHPAMLIINNLFSHRSPVRAPMCMTYNQTHAALCYRFHRYAVQEGVFVCKKLTQKTHCGHIFILLWIGEAALPSLWLLLVATILQQGWKHRLIYGFT